MLFRSRHPVPINKTHVLLYEQTLFFIPKKRVCLFRCLLLTAVCAALIYHSIILFRFCGSCLICATLSCTCTNLQNLFNRSPAFVFHTVFAQHCNVHTRSIQLFTLLFAIQYWYNINYICAQSYQTCFTRSPLLLAFRTEFTTH